jgi:hypothetical protein
LKNIWGNRQTEARRRKRKMRNKGRYKERREKIEEKR